MDTARVVKFFLLSTLIMWGGGINSFVLAAGEDAELETGSGALLSRIAPGEFLPLSVKLINFGSAKKVDVTIEYQIVDQHGNVVFSDSETVAVETTASYVKVIQIPHDVSPGRYNAKSSIVYEGQEVPAVSNYEFTVERKIAGIFQSQFLLYGGVTLVIATGFAIAAKIFVTRQRRTRFSPHEYLDIPKEQRIFYEIVSDTIMQMRSRAGDKALEIANSINGLVIDEESGKVLEMQKDPAEVVALLVLQYEQHLGKKVSFALRSPGKRTKERLAPVDKNLVVVRKYFEKNK